MASRSLPTGIFMTATGYRAFVWVATRDHPKGGNRSKRFKADTPIGKIIAWREDQQKTAAHIPAPILSATSFAADAATYLETIAALPSYKDRVRDIAEWIAIFGDEPRAKVTPARIRGARDRWMTVGPKRVLVKHKGQPATWVSQPIPLAASTINHRLRALENLYTVLDGKHAPNPVREVPECREPDPEPRGHSFALALEVLAFMPDVTTPKKKGTWEAGSLSRVRFETMLWTGLPAVQLARLKPELVNWAVPSILVPRRQKGRTSRRARAHRVERPRHLLPQAVTALKRFFALGANRSFSSSSLARSMRRAIRAANVARADRRLPPIPESIRAYDLTRHTFGTEAHRASGDLKAVQELMGHSDITQTERYARAAVNERTVLAMAELSKVSSKAARTAKSRRTPNSESVRLTGERISPSPHLLGRYGPSAKRRSA